MPESDYWNEYPVTVGGRRCGVQCIEWMGDWFASWSPRNENHMAEGPWQHWVSLALGVLQHAATGITNPDIHSAVASLDPLDYDVETTRRLTDDEIITLFPKK